MKGIFSRQIELLGEGCQRRLADATVLVAGLGGLGSLVTEALVRLGVGRLYLVDAGRVDPPDLNRQILYRWADLDEEKAIVAAERLGAIRPGVEVIPLAKRIDRDFSIPGDVQGVVDCLDNFGDRFLLADLAWQKGVFFVHGGIEAYWGQVTTISPGETPTLREVFPGVPEGRRRFQVIVPTSGIVGLLQALETVRNLCGMEPNLKGKLLTLDLYSLKMEVIELAPAEGPSP